MPHGGDDPTSAGEPQPVILITYATTEDAMRGALGAIEPDGVLVGRPQMIRIEKQLTPDRTIRPAQRDTTRHPSITVQPDRCSTAF